MLRISTLQDKKRMSTRELLLTISNAVEQGETEFVIQASGQHDIGGPLWNREGKPLQFTVYNPGQRVGAMCLPGTNITVIGSSPADAGWLNSGGTVTVRGDAGDTAAHCAASGKVYIGGRAGTRSGSLMKHDPDFEEPELWILKSCGSFSFEFMSGGKAVICGYESQTLPSIIGERSCAGMVGGTIYIRGPVDNIASDVLIEPLLEEDIHWLDCGLNRFLKAIDQEKLKKDLSIWKHWHKIIPAPVVEQVSQEISLAHYHQKSWLPSGVFGNMPEDDFKVIPLVPVAENRFFKPMAVNREKCVDCRACLYGCPAAAIQRREKNESIIYSVNEKRCQGCSLCSLYCPQKIWQMIPVAE